MTEEAVLDALLEQWGADALLECPDGNKPLRVVIQPVRDRSKQYLEDAAGPFGGLRQSRCVCWVKADETGLRLESGTLLQAGGQRWLCRRRELYTLRGKPLYLWAVLHEAQEESA